MRVEVGCSRRGGLAGCGRWAEGQGKEGRGILDEFNPFCVFGRERAAGDDLGGDVHGCVGGRAVVK